MSNTYSNRDYDEVLTSILVNEKSILGFLSSIFNFLARRTDFYYVPKGPYENMGFPPGVAEELVIKVLRKCDPKQWNIPDSDTEIKQLEQDNEIMCSTVAQEVEIIADEDVDETCILEANTEGKHVTSPSSSKVTENIKSADAKNKDKESSSKSDTPTAKNDQKKAKVNPIPEDYKPPEIPVQKNSDTYNGTETDKYAWSQTIMELDVTVKLPPDIQSSKDLKVTINAADICVARRNGDIIFKDKLPYKIKSIESFWSLSEGKLLIHLEKVQERWWNRFLDSEEPIDLSKIDCSRPLDELPEDHIAKVRELQWNQERKMQGLPTSDEIRNRDILKKAWNAPGSPFIGKEFDPSILKSPGDLLNSE